MNNGNEGATENPSNATNVIDRVLEDELVKSYLSYSMSVIIGRAIPDVRDGLKPVQRRIIYSMYELGLAHSKSSKKAARIVGEVMGKYHPHGDASIYDALVRMAQPWAMRYPIVEGQGNFGSIDRDPPAAMRYTEAKLQRIADEMIEDIDKQTVRMLDNFDGSLQEPEVLPAKLPNLLLNGASGIAVGMATNIPTHNLNNVVDAIITYVKNPDVSIEQLIDIIEGPDFPTGGIIIGKSGIREMYITGKGSFTVRGRVEIKHERKRKSIIINEIPYNVNKAELIGQIAKFLEEEEIPVKDLRDESDKDGLRIVIELPEDLNEEVILNNLYQKTNLQVRFNANFLVIDGDKQPRLMNLKQLIEAYVKHRFDVVRKRTQYAYQQDSKRAHILEGLIKASRAIDTVVNIVRSAKDAAEAAAQLMDILTMSEEQAKAVLDMRLGRLTSLETQNLQEEYSAILVKLDKEKELLMSDYKVYDVIVSELEEIKNKYGDERRTEITEYEETVTKFDKKDLVPNKDVVITLTRKGFLKLMDVNAFRTQKRNGKGVLGANLMEDDIISQVLYTKLHNKTLFFTSHGKVYELENIEVEESNRATKGKPVTKYIKLDDGERVLSMIDITDYIGDLFFVTKNGIVKRTSLDDFRNINSKGIRAITFKDGDELVSVLRVTSDQSTVLISTKLGLSIRFGVDDVRTMGRNAAGVRGIRLREGDRVISSTILDNDSGYILTITENGYGKITEVNEYRKQSRDGLGIKNISELEKTGPIVGVSYVTGNEEIVVFTKDGASIKFKISDIPSRGRVAQGVKIIHLAESDCIADFAVLGGEE
ncbi:MAG TPA: DNA gyrase subunit A [Fervidobacterium sp.]|nr:DNA gyrase subunit A [Fervidobacterium sp.]NLH37528.1 DNA gyrase subunit A [Thermotogaceae bacterium]MBP8656953.1 DNA gyrase subunit A [Fervidobacterium sp.]HCL98312.1 DNA gyrase subunit A [Fervidobacterium sp.]HOA17072.1 DNA gyrase subunit A [Fervidobacterium sp.]